MAYSAKQWADARGYFEAGLSLSEINEKTGISRSAISKQAKTEQWEKAKNADYIKAKEIIAVKKSTESVHSIEKADEVADDLIRRRGLVYGTAEDMLVKMRAAINEGKRLEKVNVGDGVQQLVPVDYGSADYKNFADANDKIAQTLGVVERHAKPAQVAVQQNSQTTNVIEGYEVKELEE